MSRPTSGSQYLEKGGIPSPQRLPGDVTFDCIDYGFFLSQSTFIAKYFTIIGGLLFIVSRIFFRVYTSISGDLIYD